MSKLNENKWILRLLIYSAVLICFAVKGLAQPGLPQRTVTLTATQGIHFGTFSLTGGSGGTITVGFNGSRSSQGDILLLSMAPTAKPAIYQIKICDGRSITITFDPSTILTGSNSGTLILDIGPTEKGGNNATFLSTGDCNFVMPLRVGGTLHIPGTALPGTYSGSFDITLNQE